MTYNPRYLDSLDDIPVQIPSDEYADREKLDALEVAESALEADVNNGEQIPSGDVNSLIVAAVKQKATCELVKGAAHPNSAKMGDIQDSGSTKREYSDVFCSRYEELVDKIISSGVLDTDTTSTMDEYVYNTSKP